jgi:RTX calcium-binding nonapeptide repeat (4 copies)
MRWLLPVVLVLGVTFGVAVAHDDVPSPTYRLPPGTEQVPVRSPGSSWRFAGTASVPEAYYQGVTSDPSGQLYFDGQVSGLYRTDPDLRETAENPDVIPWSVRTTEGYNHIGDISWDAAEGGRLLLPLECFYPALGRGEAANTCKSGAIGVADPRTLQWRYHVRLDRSIERAPWSEVSPDGKLLWTSGKRELLAFRTADISAANAAPDGPAIRPVKRLRLKDPTPAGITGATFHGDQLLVATMKREKDLFIVSSIDLDTGSATTVLSRRIVGESEGLDVDRAVPDTLRWQITPYDPEDARPTYGAGHVTVLEFELACVNEMQGTVANDRLSGGDRGDRINGFAGSDLIDGGAGADCLSGGRGRDRIAGGAGPDVIDAVDGERDAVDCGPGRDELYADRSDTAVGCERVH